MSSAKYNSTGFYPGNKVKKVRYYLRTEFIFIYEQNGFAIIYYF